MHALSKKRCDLAPSSERTCSFLMPSAWIINQHDGLHSTAEEEPVSLKQWRLCTGVFAQASRRRAAATGLAGCSPAGYQRVRFAISTRVRWDWLLRERERVAWRRWHQQRHLPSLASYSCSAEELLRMQVKNLKESDIVLYLSLFVSVYGNCSQEHLGEGNEQSLTDCLHSSS